MQSEEVHLTKYRARQVVLVDDEDNELGVEGLVEAHRGGGKKHRALSLCLWRGGKEGKEWLIQKRSVKKPVFPGLWANTCCYNLAPGESYKRATVRRVKEEMGIRLGETELRIVGRFSYFASDKDGWCENELDTVLVGEWDGEVKANPEEVGEWRWVKEKELQKWMEKKPEAFAPWFFRVWEIVDGT